MGDIKIFIWLQINSFTINYTLQCQKRAKKFSNDAKIHISLSFLLWRTEKIKWNWRKFLAVSLTIVSLVCLFYLQIYISVSKKKLHQRSFTLVLIIFFADNPKNVECDWITWSPNQSYLSFSAATLKHGLKVPYHLKDNSVN